MKRLSGNLILAGVAVAFAVGVLELALHIVDYPRTEVSQNQLLVEYDAVRGWRNVAGGRATIATDEYRVDLSYNERGLRGPVVPYAKPEGAARVLLVGDSFVDGYPVVLEDRVGEVLAGELRAMVPGRSVEVVSLGTGGYGTDQELLWLEREGLRYAPDVVVLLFYSNDVWYNRLDRYWRGAKPMFEMRADTLVLTNVPVPPPSEIEEPPPTAAARVNDFMRQRSKLFLVTIRGVQAIPFLYGLAVRMGLAEPSPELAFDDPAALRNAGEFSVFEREPPPEVDEAWRVTAAMLVRMDAAVREAGSRFLIFRVPMRGTIYSADGTPRAPGHSPQGSLDVNAVRNRLARVCGDAGLVCIDPTADFLSRADSLHSVGERLYYRYDWHWNAAGNRLAAQLIAPAIAPFLR